MQEPTTQKMGQRRKSSYPEIGNIGSDLHSLKSNLSDLAQHVKEDGLNDISALAQKEYKSITALGETIEDKIKDQPAKSMAIAFAGGLIASYLFGRR